MMTEAFTFHYKNSPDLKTWKRLGEQLRKLLLDTPLIVSYAAQDEQLYDRSTIAFKLFSAEQNVKVKLERNVESAEHYFSMRTSDPEYNRVQRHTLLLVAYHLREDIWLRGRILNSADQKAYRDALQEELQAEWDTLNLGEERCVVKALNLEW